MKNQEIVDLLNLNSSEIIKPGLERTLLALEVLGNPHLKLPKVIHFAGTNGKGSTLAFTAAILESAGFSCHRYTSPHLVEFNERIVLAGEMIGDDYLRTLIIEVGMRCAHIGLTFFEATTVVAFMAFASIKADYLLLETGMGGRLDSTNVVTSPVATVITPISLDHTEFLGDSIAEIASEKAAIIKSGCVCISANQLPDAVNIIASSAKRVGAELYSHGKNWSYEITQSGFDLYSGGMKYSLPVPSLQGIHQYMNAAVAVVTVLSLKIKTIELKNLKAGVASAVWAGRMQRLTYGKLADIVGESAEIIVDGAHNPAGAMALTSSLNGGDYNIMIAGMLKTKDAEAFLKILKPVLSKVYLVDIDGGAGAYSKEYLQTVCERLNLLAE